ncbi:Aste57867_19252 [Aphanomyces stellatus]|uniref:Aste57867_19252 protein n=1 Tax=Aphanomyces stellatus TaxID=120398 RepID=A0A485LDJ8_9STRA|nr:hypothetical protein As57867_019188 [Aphanomyces stellatus]VFT95972.1 Aste57867_19252 [Aphanomyces stellatus]
MLACSYAADTLWVLGAAAAAFRQDSTALGMLTSSGVAFMITWFSLRTYDRHAFTSLLHAEWGVWSASSVLGICSRLVDAAIHVVLPCLMLCWHLRHVRLWMSLAGMAAVEVLHRLRQMHLPFHRYLFYQFTPPRSHHFWDAASHLELMLHGSIPVFCWIAQQQRFLLYYCTIGIGGLAISIQLLRSFLLPTIRAAAADIMSRLLLQGHIRTIADPPPAATGASAAVDVVVHDPHFWLDWMSDGLVAIGESYVSGQWSLHPDSPLSLDVLLFRLLNLPVEARREMYQSWSARLVSLATRVFHYPSSAASHIVGPATDQFEVGPAFRRSYLGTYMYLGFGLWVDPSPATHVDAAELEDAQARTMRMIAQKLDLKPGNLVLDLNLQSGGGVGCFLAHTYRVQVISIVDTHQQSVVATALARQHNIHSHIQFLALDGHALVDVLAALPTGFDAITASRLLETTKDVAGALAILHAKVRGRMVLDFVATPTRANTHAWSNKYIHPPQTPMVAISYATVRSLMTGAGWVVVEAQSYGEHFDKTYVAWHARLKATAAALPDSFRRTWEFYLLHTAACFRARNLQVYQVTLQPANERI